MVRLISVHPTTATPPLIVFWISHCRDRTVMAIFIGTLGSLVFIKDVHGECYPSLPLNHDITPCHYRLTDTTVSPGHACIA